jgi:hypothetical protein
MQKVHFGETKSGIKGLFTGYFLAYGFTKEEDLEKFNKNPEGFCKNLNFELEVK